MKLLLIFLLFFLCVDIQAQLFENIELYPGVDQIIGKYFNGSGGRGYWSLEKVDTLGLIYVKESHYKDKLMSRERIGYDCNNNKTLIIHDYDINNPERVDTFKYMYKYLNNKIVYQKSSMYVNDSSEISLLNSFGDSIYIYMLRSYYSSPDKKRIVKYEKKYSLTYKNSLLIKSEGVDFKDDTKEIITYEYYNNGRLKHKFIKREPKPLIEPIYVGGPGSDDTSYKYKLDDKGRITRYYSIIKGKKFKLATYKYISK
jgi:hypothetical protein